MPRIGKKIGLKARKSNFPRKFEIDPEMGKSNSVEIRWNIIKNLQSEPDIGDFVPTDFIVVTKWITRNGI